MTDKKTDTGVKYHTQPLLGAVCAHLSDSSLALWWLGPGSTHVYIGRCMNEKTTLPMGYHRVTNPKFDYAATVKGFKALVRAFIAATPHPSMGVHGI